MSRILSISLVILLFSSLTACGKAEPPPKAEKAKLVRVMTIGTTDMGIFRTYPSRVSASQKVNLSFLVSGRLIQLPIHEGDEVKKDQLLAQIDPKDYEIRVAQQKAKYDFAKITYERYKKLLPTDAISVAQYDEKKSLYELEKANLDEAQKDLADSGLYAPFDGVIANKFVENYQFVQAKQEILSLQDIEDVEIIVNIPEQDITNAAQIDQLKNEAGRNQVGIVRFTAIKDKEFPVYVKQVQTEADPATQTYKVTLITPRPEQRIILPGMTANVTIRFTGGDEQMSLPMSAVAVDNTGKHYVWLVNKKTMTVEKQDVKTGIIRDDSVNIVSGLDAGDVVVTAGVAYLQQGMPVKILQGRIGH